MATSAGFATTMSVLLKLPTPPQRRRQSQRLQLVSGVQQCVFVTSVSFTHRFSYAFLQLY